jgi:Fe-S-cluster containining protein
VTGRAEYAALVAKVDAFAHQVVEGQSQWLACNAGCSGCCRVRRSAFAVENAAIREYLDLQPHGLRSSISARLSTPAVRDGEQCIFLNGAGECDVYPVRPIICRTHGPAVRMPDAQLAWCELNFEDMTNDEILASVPRESILDIELINRMLVLINQRYLATYGGEAYSPLESILNKDDP